jgi:hypothetical protein
MIRRSTTEFLFFWILWFVNAFCVFIISGGANMLGAILAALAAIGELIIMGLMNST